MKGKGMTESRILSNSFSTGGGGFHFEAHVQASFVTLMLTGGDAPCLPRWPIVEIILQGRVNGYDTDDLIVLVENIDTKERRKLLCQVKHSIAITRGSSTFGEVMQAAWSDFNDSRVFARDKDAIALITGPLSKTDADNTQWLLSQAKCTKGAEEFFGNVKTANFSPSKSEEKLDAIRYHLKSANKGSDISDENLYDFLKNYYLFGYDLGSETGVHLSLLHSHISQFQQQYPAQIWGRIVDFIQTWNQNAGTVTRENIPKDIIDVFKQKTLVEIPKEFKAVQVDPRTDWSRHPDAKYLAIAVLIGAWEDKNQADREMIAGFFNISYNEWMDRAREILHFPDSPLSLRNGILWEVKQREILWKLLGTHIFTQTLDAFKEYAVAVLKERDPAFEMDPENRYMANVYGNVPKHSPSLRKGIAEGLALLGSQPNVCTNCSSGKAEATCVLAVREILDDADWVLWGSLEYFLPSLAEAAPGEFLDQLEKAIHLNPSPFDTLFSQERGGITGCNYITGLIWALEGLAWDEQYFVRACIALAELSSHDPGGQSCNRPSHSLSTIFLPWLPRTLATADKRKVAVQTILKECPQVGWNLIIQLLPDRIQVSSETQKPKWRKIIPDGWKAEVTIQEYREQSSFFAELAVQTADQDVGRLITLIDCFDYLPENAFDQLLQVLTSEIAPKFSDEQRFAIWEHLTKLTRKHRRFSDAKWALPGESLDRIEHVSAQFIPESLCHLHRHLFSEHDYSLEYGNIDWEELEKNLNAQRDAAILEIFQQSGAEGVIQFAESISLFAQAGYALGSIDDSAIEQKILPCFLGSVESRHKLLAKGFIERRYQKKGWNWCDEIDKSCWTSDEIGQFLACLPCRKATWDRASKWLHVRENKYWSRVEHWAFFAEEDVSTAIEKFVEHGRPHAAINRMAVMLHAKKPVDPNQCAQALLAALASEEPTYTMDGYHVVELIKFLQTEPSASQEELFKIEWAYIALLDGHRGVTPKILEDRLANDPEFFCEAIRFGFRSTKDEPPQTELTEEQKSIATHVWNLLRGWKTPPGTQRDGTFNEECFTNWLQAVKASCTESGHLGVALSHIGDVLIHSPADPSGLWIHHAIAAALNDRDVDGMRHGFGIGIINSRGVHWVDPSGTQERELAGKYRQQAEEVENAGYWRLAETLKDVAKDYDRDAERVIAEHKRENE